MVIPVTERPKWEGRKLGDRKNRRLLSVVHALLTEQGPMPVTQIRIWMLNNKGRMYHLSSNQFAQMMSKRPHLFRKAGQADNCGFYENSKVALWEAVPQEVSE